MSKKAIELLKKIESSTLGYLDCLADPQNAGDVFDKIWELSRQALAELEQPESTDEKLLLEQLLQTGRKPTIAELEKMTNYEKWRKPLDYLLKKKDFNKVVDGMNFEEVVNLCMQFSKALKILDEAMESLNYINEYPGNNDFAEVNITLAKIDKIVGGEKDG